MISFYFVLFAVFSKLATSESQISNSSLDQLTEIAENARHEIELRLANLTEAAEDKWNIVHHLMDGDTENETATEDEGVDAHGCDRKLRKHYEDRCDERYDEKINDEAQQIEDEREKIEAVCCALEDYEKCSLRAYDQANCVTDKAAIQGNLKAARLFLTIIANISCNEFRGKCAFYSSATTVYTSYTTIAASISAVLAISKLRL